MDMERRMEMERRMGSPTHGLDRRAVFIIVVLALVFTSSEGTNTARNDVNRPPPRAWRQDGAAGHPGDPGQSPSTTGQGGQERQQ